MAKRKAMVPDQLKELLASRPDGAVTAVTDMAIWSSCIMVAHTAIVEFDKTNQWLEKNPIIAWQLVPVFTPLIFLIPSGSGQPIFDFGTDDWKWALIIGTLAFGTLKYAGNGIVDGVFGAVGSALKVVGVSI